MEKQYLFILIGAAVVLLIIFISTYFSKKAIVKRKLKRATYRRFTEVRRGEIAKIVGNVEFIDQPLKAPLSGRTCAYYHVLVEQKVSTGKSSHWKTIIEEEASSKFVLREGSRYAYIKSDKIKSYVVDDIEYKSGLWNDASNELERYLNNHQLESQSFLGLNKTIRYREGVLEENEEVAVLGTGEWRNASEIGLPSQFQRVLLIQSPAEQTIYLSDSPDTVKHSNDRF
ncbi:hypothetical protein ACUNWD_10765 [Sunxiuqinia sp. A32]|uniref:hypothetical protein n=1 Tax=Sunxiuqinia sp. A32 TaxID=3461496 RepID=UPI004046803A